jgi:3-deoxy-D-manno-octulosonic-acid transferase
MSSHSITEKTVCATGPAQEGAATPLPWMVRWVLGIYDAGLVLAMAGWLLVRLVLPPARGRQAIAERLGYVPVRPDGAPISLWIHAVSIGELLSVLPVLRLLKERHPNWWVLLSTTQRHADALAHTQSTGADAVCLLPWDSRFAIDEALNRARPELLVLVECELWPNLIVRCARRAIPVQMINARLYERDFPRYRLARGLFAPLLRLVSGIAAQSEADSDRFLRLGASAERIMVTGSTKFDAALPAELPARLRQLRDRLPLRGGPVWILASTHADEEEQILSRSSGLRERFPGMQFLIAPRHVERSTRIQELAGRLGMRTALWSESLQRSEARIDPETPDILLLDTIGELRTALGLADLVFVGGSLVNKGGQNPIEAALHAQPILMGPSVGNFAEIVSAFVSADALVAVTDADDLLRQAESLLASADRRAGLGQAAAAVVRRHVGAAQANVEFLEEAVQRRRLHLPVCGTADYMCRLPD